VYLPDCTHRVFHDTFLDHCSILFTGKNPVFEAVNCAARQTDDGIAAPLVTALHRLEKVGVGAVRQLDIGTYRRIEVREDLTCDRDMGIGRSVTVGAVGGQLAGEPEEIRFI
jgi:hypothetical protein